MNNQQVMVPERGRTLLERYGSRPEIAEFADRIARALVVRMEQGETRKFTKAEAIYLAEASLGHGLDPFVGQIYLLVVKGIPSIHVGPSGYEVQATRQLQKEGGGNWWSEYEPIVSEDERNNLLVPKGAIAYRCKLYDTPTIRAWTGAIDSMSRAGAEWREIMSILGARPYSEGLGFYVPMGGHPDKNWPPHERARKRALHAALKKRFALELDGVSDGDLAPDFTGPMRGDGERQTIIEQEATGQGNGGQDEPASGQTVEATATAAPSGQASSAPPSGQPPMPDAPPLDNAALDAEVMAGDAEAPRQSGQASQASSKIPGRPLVQRTGTRPANFKPGEANRKLFDGGG